MRLTSLAVGPYRPLVVGAVAVVLVVLVVVVVVAVLVAVGSPGRTWGLSAGGHAMEPSGVPPVLPLPFWVVLGVVAVVDSSKLLRSHLCGLSIGIIPRIFLKFPRLLGRAVF